MRLDEVSTSGAAPSLIQDFDASTPGLDEYYPAVGLDSSGGAKEGSRRLLQVSTGIERIRA
jgi:hypothetical protein